MSDEEDLSFDPAAFSGRVRLFPLPNLVLFPHVMQPVHIFEARYRMMVEEAIEDDRMLAMALLSPGWEKEYEGRPPLQPMACLGRIATYQRLADNQFNLLLLGLKRVRLLRELPPEKMFREAEVEVCEDRYPSAGSATRSSLQRQLVEEFKRILPNLGEGQEQLSELLGSNVPLGVLTDIVSYTLDLGLTLKQQLLLECDVDRRTELLIDQLSQAASGTIRVSRTKFPPEFSPN